MNTKTVGPTTSSSIISVNVGRPREVEHHGRSTKTAIWKAPVSGRVGVRGVNIEGDDQADRVAHGGTDKAIYAYAIEDYHWWEAELGVALDVGVFGENLTTEGLDVSNAVVGERWRIGTTVLEVSEPRVPCWKLNHRTGDPRFIQKFVAASRPGTYLRIIEEGDIGAGDRITILTTPEHGLTSNDIATIYHHRHDQADRLIGIDQVSEQWQAWAQHALDQSKT